MQCRRCIWRRSSKELAIKRVAALALVLASAFDAQAYTPASGFWLHPIESGTVIAIEIEDKTLFMAAYVFDAQGRSTWFTSAGNLTTSVSTFARHCGGRRAASFSVVTNCAPAWSASISNRRSKVSDRVS